MARRQAGTRSAGAVGGPTQTETADSSTTPSREVGYGRRRSTVLLAAVALALLLGTLATAIALSQRQSRSSVNNNLHLRAASSAQLVSTFLGQQAQRESRVASRFLAAPSVSAQRFQVVMAAFGSGAGVLLDSAGRLLNVLPADPALLGTRLANRYAHLSAAEGGAVAVSNVVPSAARREPVAAIAVPFQAAGERRVFSAAYGVASSGLAVFAAHTIAYRPHQVFLVDASGRLLAASPTTPQRTLAQADPKLALALAHSSFGSVGGASVPTTFTTAPVAGTPWRLVIAIPNSRLYTSIGGLTLVIPWLVFALVSVLGVLLVAMFARSLSDRARLARLSLTLRRTARTDALTGLYNRRALGEQLARMIAHARRRREPISVLMIDLDLFKQTNDCFGHEAGDRVLCAVADSMREVLRADDLYGRWGGDEFLIALPASDQNAAYAVAERLRAVASRVDLRDIALPAGVPMSIGVASGLHTTPDELVRAADVALYENKTAGRAAEGDGAGSRDAMEGAPSQA